jgi:methionine synthase I (cobalamin-dependent)
MALDIQALAGRMRVVDGAWGTTLQQMGLPPGMPPEVWNVEKPDAVADLAAGYVQAGCEVLCSNTFGANRFVLAGHGRADQAADLAARGVELSRRAAGDAVPVLGSVGPTGRVVMMGDVPAQELAAAFSDVARAMADAGADGILIESFSELEEMALAIRAVDEVADVPVIVSMSFGCGAGGTTTIMGNTPEQLAELARANGAVAVGANCGAGPDTAVHIAKRYRKVTDLPLWIKPNAGLPQIHGGRTVYPMHPENFASYAAKMAAASVTFLGGCCGTTPEHIEALRAAVDELGAA